MPTSNHTIRTLVLGLALLAGGLSATVAVPATAQERGADAELMHLRLNILNQYFEIVNSFHAIAHNPEKAAVFSLQQLEESYKAQGKHDEIVKMYEKMLKEAKNQTLRNTAYIKLSEIHKRTGRPDQAVTLLQKALDENLKVLK